VFQNNPDSMLILFFYKLEQIPLSATTPWPNARPDGAGPSTGMKWVGFGRVQMIMRQLAGVGGT